MLAFNTLFLFFIISWKVLLLCIPLIIIFFSIFFTIDNSTKLGTKIDDVVYVHKKINSGVFVKYKNEKIYVKTYESLSINDLINLKSDNLEKINPTKSNFYQYLKSESVNFIANNPTIKYVGTKYTIKRKVNDFFERGPSYYSRYVPLIMFGIRNEKNQVIIDKIKNISILHLFTISGFHINLLILFINKILERFKLKNKYIFLFVPFILIPYILIMNMPIAATRALMFSILLTINKYFFNSKFNKLNLLSITMLTFFLFNPYIVFSTSFIFTYLITYAIVLTTSNKNMMFFYIWFFSSFVNIIASGEMNITSLIISLIFTPIISFSYILTFLFFWLVPVMNNYYFLIDILINFFQYLKIGIKVSLILEFQVIICFVAFLSIIIFMKKPIIEKITKIKKYSSFWWINKH